jgi:DNA polymerase elongation subunit (family B)
MVPKMTRLLMLDIETAPHKVYAWGLYDQRIGLNQIVEPGYTLCYAAKWYGERGIMFDSVHQSTQAKMLKSVHKLLDEADAVCHYNGERFDVPTLEGEFAKHRMRPPSPFKHIDLLKTCRRRFKLASNKLDYVAQLFGLGQKTSHKGMPLWTACMNGEDTAWRTMERYNKQDVRLLEKLYEEIRPWVKNHPNFGAISGEHCCPLCESQKLQRRGYYVTRNKSYAQFQCRSCFAWLYEVSGKLQKGLQGMRQAA